MGLSVHINRRHPVYNEDQQLVCALCTEPFTSISLAEAHIRAYHFASTPYHCTQCPKKFPMKHKLNDHIKKAHEVVTGEEYLCDKCDRTFTKINTLKSHKASAHGGVFPCELCGKVFTSRSSLNAHGRKMHEKIQYVVCEECGKEFKSIYSLKDHIKLHVAPEDPEAFKCPEEGCGKAFGRARALKNHTNNVHVGKPKNSLCRFCPMKFYNASSVKQHENAAHLNVKDLKCDQCDFTASYRNTLTNHIKTIHEGQLFNCEVPGCTKSYNQRGNLYKHQHRVHKIPRPKQRV